MNPTNAQKVMILTGVLLILAAIGITNSDILAALGQPILTPTQVSTPVPLPTDTPAPTPTPVPQNLLSNEGFQWWCGWGYTFPVCPPNYWEPVQVAWVSDADASCKNASIDYEIETDPRYTDADGYAARWHVGYASAYGGIYQSVPVTKGSWYSASASMYLWAGDGIKGNPSIGSYNIRGRIGISPSGAIDLDSPDIVWGDVWALDQYTTVSTMAQAQASKITVFIASQFRWCLARNDVRVGWADLHQIDAP